MDSQIASYSLLYAEDDQWLAEPIIASLQKDGYEVIYAHDGFDALAKYRRLHPDIILLDIRMPGLDGYEVAKEIRKEDPGVPILFLTVLSDPKDAIKGLSVGADDYIRKSVAVEELKARLISKASEVETDSRYHTAHDAQYDQSRDYHRRRRSQADAERIRVDLPLLPSHERDSRKTGVGRSAVAGKYERKQLPE